MRRHIHKKSKHVLKFTAGLLLIGVCLSHLAVVWALYHERWRRSRKLNQIAQTYCRLILRSFGIIVNVKGREHLFAHDNYLLVGNHLSYLDILIIGSERPLSFVTSTDMKDTPGLGHLCQLGGCLFVNRRDRKNLSGEIREISEGLRNGLSVVVFPEAASTNGEQLLRFRKPLYRSALEVGKPVLPFCLNYKSIDGVPLSIKNRDIVFWYGDMDFMGHLWEIMKVERLEVELNFLAPIYHDNSLHPAQRLDLLVSHSREAVAKIFQPVSVAPGNTVEL